MCRRRGAFTLIELLIVVAIIAILAAIAVPNFLEAQVRAKVARCLADTRAIAVALETYRTENSRYPSREDGDWGMRRLALLSTPVPYITRVPRDPFAAYPDEDEFDWHWLWHRDAYIFETWENPNVATPFGIQANRTYAEAYRRGSLWFLVGRGPDRLYGVYMDSGPLKETAYDPSNGTISFGDIERFGP